MLHAKFRGNRPADSREEDFWRVFTIYGPGGHLGHVTRMPRTNFRSPYPSRLHIKFGFDRPGGFREEDLWTLWTDGLRTDGWMPDHEYPISSPMSLRLRWAKNATIVVWGRFWAEICYLWCFFYDFSLIFEVFVNIHEYANYLICTSSHGMKRMCTAFNLVPSLVV